MWHIHVWFVWIKNSHTPLKFNQRIMLSRGRILRSPMLNKPLYIPSIVCTCEPCYRSHCRVEISFSVLTLLRNCIRQLPWQQLLYHLYNFEKSFLLTYTVILLPLHPAPMTHKNSQRCKRSAPHRAIRQCEYRISFYKICSKIAHRRFHW